MSTSGDEQNWRYQVSEDGSVTKSETGPKRGLNFFITGAFFLLSGFLLSTVLMAMNYLATGNQNLENLSFGVIVFSGIALGLVASGIYHIGLSLFKN